MLCHLPSSGQQCLRLEQRLVWRGAPAGHPPARTTGCSEQEGDREAHQGQPSQTRGGKNRDGLDHRQLQQGQNLEQFLRPTIIPGCCRCNPLRQRKLGECCLAFALRAEPIPEALMAAGLSVAVALESHRGLDDQPSSHQAADQIVGHFRGPEQPAGSPPASCCPISPWSPSGCDIQRFGCVQR